MAEESDPDAIESKEKVEGETGVSGAQEDAAGDDEVEELLAGDDAAGLAGVLDKVSLSIFANVDFVHSDEDEENDAFENGALDLFLTSQLGERWSVLVELVFETDEDDELISDLERLRFAYDRSDRLRLEFGRMHNSLVRWNVEQHHGLYLQTTASKPLMTEWEDDGGLWPAHVVGVRASGTLEETAGLHWEVTVANGRGGSLDEIQVTRDANSSKALALSLGFEPAPGLGLTVASYHDDIPAPGGEIREDAYTLSARYLRHGFELRSEVSRLDHERPSSGESWETIGWYALFSYRLPGMTSLRPYLMLEEVDPAQGNPFLEGAQHFEALSLGLRWDLSRGVALKSELRDRELAGASGNELRLQLAVGI